MRVILSRIKNDIIWQSKLAVSLELDVKIDASLFHHRNSFHNPPACQIIDQLFLLVIKTWWSLYLRKSGGNSWRAHLFFLNKCQILSEMKFENFHQHLSSPCRIRNECLTMEGCDEKGWLIGFSMPSHMDQIFTGIYSWQVIELKYPKQTHSHVQCTLFLSTYNSLKYV